MPLKLDVYDKKILYQLDVNSRQSYLELARKVGLSKDAVKYRIQNYLKTNLISGFYTLIDAIKLGHHMIRLYFKFRNTKPQIEREIIQSLIDEPNTFWVGRNDGSCDIAVGYWSNTLDSFNNFWSKFKNKYSKYITNDEFSLFIEFTHFQRNYLAPKHTIQKQATMKECLKINIDSTDRIILETLATNARTHIINISKKANLTSKAIITRIKTLERKGIILGYKPKINLEKIGYSMYKIDITLRNQENLQKLKNILFQSPNIIQSEKSFGGSDLEFDLEISSFDEYEEIINRVKEEYGDDIESIKYYRTLEVYKTLFLPSE
jgi:DNA-binding Lrp family transcriptional regulator